MEQHPVPRQITTFEFKLIGFMTLRQFIYLVVFIPLGFIAFKLIPIFLVNIVLAVFFVLLGFALSFMPINERPLDVFLRNLIKRLTSPTQYAYHKDNPPVYFLSNLVFSADPHRIFAHIDSKEKLTKYIASTKKTQKQTTKPILKEDKLQEAQPKQIGEILPVEKKEQGTPLVRQPFLSGLVKNSKNLPIPGILIYMKNEKGETIRLLKTNPHGVFATYNKLEPGSYNVELKDPQSHYFFDTMKIALNGIAKSPFEFISKEIL